MYQALRVRGVERGGELHQQIDSPIWLERPRFLKKVSQVGPVDKVHDEEQQALVLSGVMDPDYVGMLDRGGDTHLSLEPLLKLRVIAQFGSQRLQRVDLVQRDVGHAIHNSHPAPADHAVDAIAPDNDSTLELAASDLHPRSRRATPPRRPVDRPHGAAKPTYRLRKEGCQAQCDEAGLSEAAAPRYRGSRGCFERR